MRFFIGVGSLLALPLLCIQNAAAQDADIEALRAEVTELRAEYETRISALEQRLAIAEQNAASAAAVAAAAPTAASSPPIAGGASANTAFNPAIGVIFEGKAWNYQGSPDNYSIQGFPLAGEAGPTSEGLALGETEIDMSANIDDKFTAWLTTPIAIDNGEASIDIEEAWIETLALPAGLSARFGRFFSGIGYLNNKHSHAWDFEDQPLAYQALLGNQYIDDGVQLRWLAPTAVYMELGAELLRGSQYPAAGAAHSGAGSKSLYINFGGDVGTSSSWLAGVSHLDTTAIDRPSGDVDAPLLFSGDAGLTIAQFVWKWAPNGNWRQRNFVFQTEMLWSDEDGAYTLADGTTLGYDNKRQGWYAQAVYQPIPHWRFGARLDRLSSDDPGAEFAGTPLAAPADDPSRYSVMVDWSNSEFSRVRLQYSRDDAGFDNESNWGLQYLHSMGAHGAHTF